MLEFYSSFPNTKRENSIKWKAMRFHVDSIEFFSIKSKTLKPVLQHFSRTAGSHYLVEKKKVLAVNQQRQHFGSIHFQALGLKPAFSKNKVTINPGIK